MRAQSAKERAVTAEDAKKHFAEMLERAATSKERVIVTRGGKRVAALVPVEDVEFLEELEDKLDAEDLRLAREEWLRGGRRSKPFDQIVQELRLKL